MLFTRSTYGRSEWGFGQFPEGHKYCAGKLLAGRKAWFGYCGSKGFLTSASVLHFWMPSESPGALSCSNFLGILKMSLQGRDDWMDIP